MQLSRAHVETIIIMKAVITIGLLAVYFLPREWAMVTSAGANLLWIWKV